jgi:hypothetical protein
VGHAAPDSYPSVRPKDRKELVYVLISRKRPRKTLETRRKMLLMGWMVSKNPCGMAGGD